MCLILQLLLLVCLLKGARKDMRNYTSCSLQRILQLGILFQLKIFQTNLSTWFHSQINPDFYLTILEPQGIGLGVKVIIPCVVKTWNRNASWKHGRRVGHSTGHQIELGIPVLHGSMEEE